MFQKIQLDLRFEGTNPESIILKGFLPEAKADGLHVSLREGRYLAVIYMSDRRKQKGNVSDFPADPEELKNHMTLMCRGLTVEIEDTKPDADVIADLEAKRVTKGTESYALEIVQLGIQIHNGIVEYFRNFANQIWLEPIISNPNSEKTPQFLVSEFKARWLDSNGEWQPFAAVVKGPGIALSFRSNFGRSVDRAEWDQVATFVEKFVETRKRAPLFNVLLANSHQHLDSLDGRLAVMEAVIALESALKLLLSKVLPEMPGFPQMNEKTLNGLIQEAGLRFVAKAVLKTIATSVGLNDDDIDTALEAIVTRNRIIHLHALEIDVAQARRYVAAIEKVVKILVHRADSAKATSL